MSGLNPVRIPLVARLAQAGVASYTLDPTSDDPAPDRRPDYVWGVDAARLMSGEAWDDFCDKLKETGRHVLAEANLDTELDRSDGFRYLANLTQAGIRHAFNLDPRFPKWVRHPDSTSKYGAENADNIYHFSKIRSDLRYRISGRRNTATAFLLETKEGYMQLGDVENYSTLDSEASQ